jgi:hypothetical protein
MTAVFWTETGPGPDPKHYLNNNVVEQIIELELRGEGWWVIFGKLVVENLDNGAQSGTALLRAGINGANLLDQSDWRISGGDNDVQSCSLQGLWEVTATPGSNLVDIAASAVNSQANEVSLIAIKVEGKNVVKETGLGA